MKLITCPEIYGPEDTNQLHWVFLAGGITGCPDWQSYAIDQLKDVDDILLFNPRRPNFDVTDTSIQREQIQWEVNGINMCDLTLFWFPSETLCPITLFELGRCIGAESRILVGADPNYARRVDLEIQTELLYGKKFPIYSSLDDTIQALKDGIQNGVL